MDVGCGTGLLAMMMIRDGEVELVHAVEVGTALSLSFNSLLPGWHHGDGGLDRTPAP
jgi:tRNA A22 N-methylase